MSTKILATNAFWVLIAHMLSRGGLMLSTIVLSRSFDTHVFATYAYFQLTISMLSTYAAMGLGIAASRFFAEFTHKDNKADNQLLGTLVSLSFGISVFVLIIILLIPADWLNSGLDISKWLLAAGVFVLALKTLPVGAALGLELFKKSVVVSVCGTTLLFLCVFLALRLNNIQYAIYGIILSEIILLLGYSWIVTQEVGLSSLMSGLRLKSDEVKKVISFSGPMFFSSLIPATATWLIGRMLLGLPNGDYAFALFVIGMQWFSLALFLPGMVSRVLLPRLIREGKNNASDNTVALVKTGTLLAVGVAFLFLLVGLALDPWLLGFYGEQYVLEKWFIATFLVAAVFSAPANTIGNSIIVNDGQWVWLILTIVWVIVLLFIAILMKHSGAWAAAWAYLVSYSVMTVSAVIVARKREII